MTIELYCPEGRRRDLVRDSTLNGIDFVEVLASHRTLVVHCLRHSLATMLAVHGVPMAYAQRILRHRDIRLTAETYQDEAMLPLAGAMATLPALTAERPAMKLPRTA